MNVSIKGRKTLGALVALTTVGGLTGFAPAANAIQPYTVGCGPARHIDLALAIENANNNLIPDTINLAKKCTYSYGTPFGNFSDTALPEIIENLTINGNGSTIKRASDGYDMRVLFNAADDLVLRDLTIKGGRFDVTGSGATVVLAAGIANTGGLRATKLKVTGNTLTATDVGAAAVAAAAGLGSLGPVELRDSEISGNKAAVACTVTCAVGLVAAGGIGSTDELELKNTKVKDNSAKAFGGLVQLVLGGGIAHISDGFADERLEVTDGKVSSNAAQGFGGLVNLAAGGGVLAAASDWLDPADTDDIDDYDTAFDGTELASNEASSDSSVIADAMGGGLAQIGGDVFGVDIDVEGNKATSNASGGHAFGAGLAQLSGFAHFEDSDFTKNVAKASKGVAQGGGWWIAGSAEADGGSISKNTASGGIAQGGGLYALDGSTVDLFDVELKSNKPQNCYYGNSASVSGCY
ncbi:MAG: hypothetical protein ACRDV9_14880 [Acidimicrobiia bacterium]